MVLCLHQGPVAHRVILLQEHLDVQLERDSKKQNGSKAPDPKIQSVGRRLWPRA